MAPRRVGRIACQQREIVDGVHGLRSLGAVIHAHRPTNKACFGSAVKVRDLVDQLGGKAHDTADILRLILFEELA
jgi:hypothetical protein